MVFQACAFGRPGGRPRVFFTGGIHGDEYEPMAALRRLARLLERAEVSGEVTLVPLANEEAFRLGARVAGDGLDLARTFPGRPDGTITEAVADALTPLIRNANFYVDLHTGGERLAVHPLCGYMLHPDPAVLDAQRRLARAFGLPIVWGTDPSLQGRSLSVARDANVPALYAEFLGGGCDPRGVDAYVKGCLNLLRSLGMIAGTPEPPPFEPLVVEDPRVGSGHMQVRHPSPCEGFFEPAVKLGQRVEAGEPLGLVTDPLGRACVPVPADGSGVVIVLRRRPCVEAGESLGVVLETDGAPPPWDV
ncbi:MAG: succinylglutamate desuccinylase/aspartoacylase family protein [Isosphaeraceae bacterium]